MANQSIVQCVKLKMAVWKPTGPVLVPCASNSSPSFSMSGSPCALDWAAVSSFCCTISISASRAGPSFAFHRDGRDQHSRRRPSNSGRRRRARALGEQQCALVNDPVWLQYCDVLSSLLVVRWFADLSITTLVLVGKPVTVVGKRMMQRHCCSNGLQWMWRGPRIRCWTGWLQQRSPHAIDDCNAPWTCPSGDSQSRCPLHWEAYTPLGRFRFLAPSSAASRRGEGYRVCLGDCVGMMGRMIRVRGTLDSVLAEVFLVLGGSVCLYGAKPGGLASAFLHYRPLASGCTTHHGLPRSLVARYLTGIKGDVRMKRAAFERWREPPSSGVGGQPINLLRVPWSLLLLLLQHQAPTVCC